MVNFFLPENFPKSERLSINVAVLSRWNEGMDTASIAEAIELPEARVADIVSEHSDSRYREHQRVHARRPSKVNRDDFDARDRVIVQLRREGKSQTEIAKAFSITPGRVSQVLKAYGVASFRAVNPTSKFTESRLLRIVELYNAGLSLAELAERECTNVPALSAVLSGRHDYQARIGNAGFYARAEDLSVPGWVPDGLIPRYVRLALRSGEDVAARCIRNAKRLGLPR